MSGGNHSSGCCWLACDSVDLIKLFLRKIAWKKEKGKENKTEHKKESFALTPPPFSVWYHSFVS